MERAEILNAFDQLNVWNAQGTRAPHKPLLVLYALGRWRQGSKEGIYFREAYADLEDLLREFGPMRSRLHPEYPFFSAEE